MRVSAAIPEVGQIVRVRQRLYLVEGLVARPRPQDSTLVELSCIEDDAQGQELAVLWERELDAAILTGEEWARLAQRGFDPPEYFSAYLNTLRWNCVTSTDATLLQSPFRAGIRLDNDLSRHQPVWAVYKFRTGSAPGGYWDRGEHVSERYSATGM